MKNISSSDFCVNCGTHSDKSLRNYASYILDEWYLISFAFLLKSANTKSNIIFFSKSKKKIQTLSPHTGLNFPEHAIIVKFWYFTLSTKFHKNRCNGLRVIESKTDKVSTRSSSLNLDLTSFSKLLQQNQMQDPWKIQYTQVKNFSLMLRINFDLFMSKNC